MTTNPPALTTALARLHQMAASGNVALDGVPEAVYHAFPAMSATGLKEFRKGPGYFKHWRENPGEDTQARLEGRLVHMSLGEPDRLKQDVVVVDGHRGRTDVKEEIAHYKGQGLTVCKPEDMKMALETGAFCRKHPRIAELLRAGVAERTLLWKDPTTGAQCKARVDWMTPTMAMADWKTFDKVYDDDALEYQIRTMFYQFQSAWYLEGFYRVYGRRARAFYHGFIRHEPPYDAAVREICQHSVEETIPYIQRALARYAECVQKNHWPMTAPDVGDIEVKPFWK